MITVLTVLGVEEAVEPVKLVEAAAAATIAAVTPAVKAKTTIKRYGTRSVTTKDSFSFCLLAELNVHIKRTEG